MSATTVTAPATTATGDLVDAPPYVDPVAWPAFAANVAILPFGGCHLWIGDQRRGQPYWPGRPLITGVARDLGAHWYAAMGWLGANLDLPGHPQPVTHACGEPLCVPVTRAAVLEHLALGECHAVRRRSGSNEAVRDAIREAIDNSEDVFRAYLRACDAPRTPGQADPTGDALF